MLTYHEATHQICFCTLNSLQAIEIVDGAHVDIAILSEPILEALMLDRNIDEKTASDILYTSNTFAKISDKNTGLYLKPWQEIYEMLKQEL